ncbi:MAG: hypothetical protein RL215_1478 [Planctomycetota bacterium]
MGAVRFLCRFLLATACSACTLAGLHSPANAASAADENTKPNWPPIANGLKIALSAAPENANTSSTTSDPVALLPNLAGTTEPFQQPNPNRRPKRIQIGNSWVLRFDGQDDCLRLENTTLSTTSATIFIVAAPHNNPGDFRGLFAANAGNARDYESGFTLDLGPGPTRAFEQLNVEGRGFGGAQDLQNSSTPFGTLQIIEAAIDSTSGSVQLTINGKPEGQRSLQPGTLSLEQLTLGARYYTNGPGAQQVRGELAGDIAELLVYDRILAPAESQQLRQALEQKYRQLAADLPNSLNLSPTPGIPLELAHNPPPVQMLVPGFDVRELPLLIPNVNNLRYRDDGTLVALCYNGDVLLLKDTNGDGLEDHANVFYKNSGSLRGPIGIVLTPPNDPRGRGLFVASKGRITLIADTNADDKADKEVVVAEGWQEIPQNVDATGLALAPDGSLYFGLGTANFANAWQVDDHGVAAYDLHSDRGTVQRISPDFATRETICTGIRFPIAFAFNHHGDLFCTEQEGATWLANGNPLDELLHIRLQPHANTVNPHRKQHFGFPPRHPQHNPAVIDEPSTMDFGPQHQSTCGMVFNEPVNGGPVFGPTHWQHQALIAGESRGKIWKTQLVPTPAGYVASSQLIACLQMLTVDQCVAPNGDLLVACHSGPPDWGTGPTGIGKLFRIRMTQPHAPRPVAAWVHNTQEIRIAFDQPIDPLSISGLSSLTRIEYGNHVRAGDRFESLVPPYAVVKAQQLQPRFQLAVGGAALTADRRTIVLNTPPLPALTHFAVSLPFQHTNPPAPAQTDSSVPTTALPPQHPWIDVDLSLAGIEAEWLPENSETAAWSGWIPHANPDVTRELTLGSTHHEQLQNLLRSPGKLRLRTRLNLHSMLRPAIQPGASIDYEWPPEITTLTVDSPQLLQMQAAHSNQSPQPAEKLGHQHRWTAPPDPKDPVLLELLFQTGPTGVQAEITWHTNEDPRQRPFPLHRFILPWAPTNAVEQPATPTRPPELAGGSWGRGRQIFHSPTAACSRCHSLNGQNTGIGPDLGNLVHRDYHSVARDIRQPSFAINPDYSAQVVQLHDGRILTGVLQTRNGALSLGDAEGRWTALDRSQIEHIQPSSTSLMPHGLLDKLTPEQIRDLLAYLLSPPPQMPLDSPLTAPPIRTPAEVATALAGSIPTHDPQPLHIVLVDGPKDHGPGEHDYPAWKSQWEELLAGAEAVKTTAVREFPSDELLAQADVLVFFQKGSFSPPRPERLDDFLNRGGGAVYIHWAVNGNDQVHPFSERIGLASWGGKIAFRHGPLTLDFQNTQHPILRNFSRLQLYDESYWKLTGNPEQITLLATSQEDGQPTPQMWVREHGRGRIFVSIPGHYSWTFDDPLFRILLLRGICWTARQPVDRLNELVIPGARMSR